MGLHSSGLVAVLGLVLLGKTGACKTDRRCHVIRFGLVYPVRKLTLANNMIKVLARNR